MKKIYQTPETTQIAVHVSSVIATSPTVTLNTYGSIDASKVESRSNKLWEDDEEEEAW